MSGLRSQIGFSAESTYGTFVTPAAFVRARSYEVGFTPTRVQGDGIATGTLGPLGGQFVQTVRSASGTIELDVQTARMGLLLQTLMGTAVTPAQIGTSAAYTQTHTLADTRGRSLTVQVGAPYRAGSTVIAQTMVGAKIPSASFSCAVDGLLTGSFTLDGRDFTTTQTLATASYASGAVPFHGGQMAVRMGTFNSETAVSGVRSVTVNIERPHDASAYTAGQSGLKLEPVLNGLANITVSIEANWLDKATFQDLAHATTPTSFAWEFVGGTIGGGNSHTFRVTLPSIHFEPVTQGVGGVGELTQTWNATWRFDGTNLPVITVISADTSL